MPKTSKPVILFVLLTYIISWAFIYPSFQMILHSKNKDIPPLAFIGLIGQYGPTIIALVIVTWFYGKSDCKNLLRKYLQWKQPLKWYLFVLLLPVLIRFAATLSTSFSGYKNQFAITTESFYMLPVFLLIALPFGPLGEELGWRGFLLPELLKKNNWVVSSLVTGCVWTVWHLASFTLPGAALPSVFEVNAFTLFLYFLETLFKSFILTFVYLKTNGNLILAILLHASQNASSNITGSFFTSLEGNASQQKMIYYLVIIFLGITVAVIYLFNNKKLTTFTHTAEGPFNGKK